MKKTIEELAYNELEERMGSVMSLLDKEYKDKRPFGKKPKSIDAQLEEYNAMQNNPEMTQQLVEQYGEDDIMRWADKMQKISDRRMYA